ncbi:MAG: peptidoglycan DD-metalloendopeptidase family protein [Burkholderiaceae bacterium]
MLVLRQFSIVRLLPAAAALLAVAGCASTTGVPAPVEHRDLTPAMTPSAISSQMRIDETRPGMTPNPTAMSGQAVYSPAQQQVMMAPPAASVAVQPPTQPTFSPPPQVMTEPVPQTARIEARPLVPATQIGAVSGATAGVPNAVVAPATGQAQPQAQVNAPADQAAAAAAAPRPIAPATQIARPAAPAKLAMAPAAQAAPPAAPAAPKVPSAPVTSKDGGQQAGTVALAKPDAAPRPVAGDKKSSFIWPVNGDVVESFKNKKSKGIGIAGRAGDPIAAAADGEVIFSGLGPRGYGKLLIVKHKSDWLSVYAHNKSLLVKEGQAVRQGQTIAELGSTGTDRPKLHFEIRRQGKPVDPVALLPIRQ